MTESTTRLHITPLNPDLLPSVLPASVRPSATDISFHSLPTFPENNYGYITLPTMEAEKIQKKLNGKILKGKKFKIETARPSKRQRNEEETAEEPPAEKKKSKKSKSSKSEDGVIEGFELPADRKVKRGWTESSKKDKHRSDKKSSKKDKKEKPQPKSKYTDKSEMLFRTNLPPNRAAEESEEKKAKKKKKSSKETVVHEFEKTYTQPSFLRSSGEETKPTTSFDEEKGWVDASGDVKESASKKSRKDNYRPGQVAGTKEKRSAKKAKVPESKPESSSESEDWTSSSGSSDESSGSDSDDDSSDDSSNDSVMEEAPTDQEPSKTSPSKATPPTSEDEDSQSNSESTSQPADKQEEKTQEPVSQEVHPLEALFKRVPQNANEQQQQPAEDTNAGFSFFGNGDIESEDETQSVAPQTPFTKRDLQDRGMRSAAPTPDTTMINRRINWDEEDDMDEEASIDTPVSKSRSANVDAKDDTEFTKWFWENRGDNNRAWKKRRRDAAKEQRQRENRKKGMKGRS
ncbi:hypothetical protein PENSTE_c001G08712 [Penicillium steckii]|uniref:Suppressor protein SRP40 n=1 Tax=Penicillium steckii TaxID=303698 RepID=A0A1V6TXZ0_9EURO|nr:hypothetical protein PENSTE_c001G08712 [Penicillium steckii]